MLQSEDKRSTLEANAEDSKNQTKSMLEFNKLKKSCPPRRRRDHQRADKWRKQNKLPNHPQGMSHRPTFCNGLKVPH